MLDNPCLRPAALSDLPRLWRKRGQSMWEYRKQWIALEKLYRTEWAKRGYQESP